MKVIYVIQARTNSTRLPAKVLLPINKFPIAVLAAKRASNLGVKTIVLTSKEKTDDYLCEILGNNGIAHYRGSLNNTLDRFVTALHGYEDDTIVVRLTADNVVPDGAFISAVVNVFIDSNVKYISTTGDTTGLPYGLSAEVMYLSSLREASINTNDSFDCEHVTPYIRRKYGDNRYNNLSSLNLANLRCTIDTLDDYLYMASVLHDVSDVINECALNIMKILNEKNNE
jgi:spore coat polysaccharide biosynthesis protein SpsF (cytidylyltransferase family)